MRTLVCAAVRSQLEAYHDGELAAGERLIVAAHLEECRACAKLADELNVIAGHLRSQAVECEIHRATLQALSSSVITRVKAEREASLPVQVGHMFEDMHFVWAGLSATAATVGCAALLFVIWFLSPAERADSLSGMLATLSSPVAERVAVDRNLPAAVERDDWLVPAMLANGAREEDLVVALAALVTQDGRVAPGGMLPTNHRDREAVLRLMNAVSEARFQPIIFGGSSRVVNPVNLVWLTTVRGKLRTTT